MHIPCSGNPFRQRIQNCDCSNVDPQVFRVIAGLILQGLAYSLRKVMIRGQACATLLALGCHWPYKFSARATPYMGDPAKLFRFEIYRLLVLRDRQLDYRKKGAYDSSQEKPPETISPPFTCPYDYRHGNA